MNINQVKNVIAKTNCVDYIFSASYCSEPIMSKDSNGILIDNYVVFSRNEDYTQISSPQCIFGIYSEKEKVAYIDDTISKKYSEQLYQENFCDEKLMVDARKQYIDLFPIVRRMYQFNSDIDISEVSKYVESLKCISGDTLFAFYNQLFPSFFEWIKELAD